MEVDGVCDCPDWLQQLLKDPPQPFAAELQAEAAANPSAKAAIEYLQKLHEAKLYNELTDAFAYCIQLSDSVDSSSTPQLQLLQSSLGLPPPSIALDKQFKLFLSFAAELVAQVDSLRILKLCAGLLADIPAEAGLLFIEKLKAETQNKKSSHSKLLQGDSQQEKGLSSAAARCFLHALKSYLIAKTQQQQQQQQEEQQLQQLQQAQELLEAAKKQLKDIRSPDPILHSFIHRAQAEIDKARNKYGDFCRETLFFLAYTSANTLKEKERFALARQIAVAALIAPEVFNFGELLQQAIVREAWERSPSSLFVFELLKSVAEGSIKKFNKTFAEYERDIMQSELSAHIPAIQKKAAATALLRLAFTSSTAGAAARSSSDNSNSSSSNSNSNSNSSSSSSSSGRLDPSRALSFAAISEACDVPDNEVEKIILSAMAQQLIRGKINQVNKTVALHWVKPVLLTDAESIQALQSRLCRWASSAEELQQLLQQQTAELLRA